MKPTWQGQRCYHGIRGDCVGFYAELGHRKLKAGGVLGDGATVVGGCRFVVAELQADVLAERIH